MGNMFAEQNNKTNSHKTTNSNEQMYRQNYTDLNLVEKLTKSATETTTTLNQQMSVKTPKEKCDEIAEELNRLQEEVHQFSGQKYDKNFLKLDELLTRCLLKLDEIDRSDENVNQQRKTLISFTHELADHLENKCQTSLVPLDERSLVLTNANSLTPNTATTNEIDNSFKTYE